LTFLGASQAQKWAKLVALHGSPDLAQSKFERRLADELTSRGVIDVLRKGVKDLGVHFDLAYFAPAHELTPERRALYDANRLSVTRQVHHSESNPAASVDLVLFVNGIPLATAEPKTQTAGQDVRDAIRQYREERNPADLIFRARSVVNLAVDQDGVYTTTRIAKQLRQALEGKQARIIITTLQKFPVVAQAATNLSWSRFAVSPSLLDAAGDRGGVHP